MSATAQEAPSLHELVGEIYEQGKTTRDIAEAAAAAATEQQNHEAAIQGWQDVIRNYERSLWRKQSVRSGHNNDSGRFSDAAALPDRGILGKTVRLNDGTSCAVGELTSDLLERLKAEYGDRKRHNASGEKFFGLLHRELRAAKKTHASELGEERVEKLQTQAGYRV